jgi:serine/threonine protein phosphatase PrpC
LSLFRTRDTSIQVSVSALSDAGQTRQHNEDRFLIANLTTRDMLGVGQHRYQLGPQGSLLMVADGMGGAAAGERASQMAADLIYEQLAMGWCSEQNPNPELFIVRVREAVERANRRIYDASQSQPDLMGMGTTATIAGLLGTRLLLSQVGDSRAYVIRDGVAVQMTRDQSLVQHLLDTGRVTQEEAHEMAPRNLILQALGPSPSVEVVQGWQPIVRNDVLLLCSDGLSGLVPPEELAHEVQSASSLGEACERLIAVANERGGPDNITVVVAHLTGDGLPTLDELESSQAYG